MPDPAGGCWGVHRLRRYLAARVPHGAVQAGPVTRGNPRVARSRRRSPFGGCGPRRWRSDRTPCHLARWGGWPEGRSASRPDPGPRLELHPGSAACRETPAGLTLPQSQHSPSPTSALRRLRIRSSAREHGKRYPPLIFSTGRPNRHGVSRSTTPRIGWSATRRKFSAHQTQVRIGVEMNLYPRVLATIWSADSWVAASHRTRGDDALVPAGQDATAMARTPRPSTTPLTRRHASLLERIR
jgi:hypothetical protein